MRDIKVVVIDDSAFMRKMIFDILQSDEQIEVVATARNGLEGLKKIEKFSPNVVTLDVEMPKMDGIMTLTEIMSRHPLPVVMLASTSNEGTTDKTIQAMDRGAVDFIRKPSWANFFGY
ncbi:response regulator [Paracerasibacillus soli]|uniref:Response regulator n=1 Tax=Paracerasibacillus soli TaxID=480284 RepID=A0ABU5CPB5_9BACI|nr:response regulator [Virgibacillus soli]MDY0408180.1 response regulator [Virgibacillus soli]